MAENILFVTGIEPTNSRAKNLPASEPSAHAARISHQRRKATTGASVIKPRCAWNTNKPKGSKSGISSGHLYQSIRSEDDLAYPTMFADDDLFSNQYPGLTLGIYDEDEGTGHWAMNNGNRRRYSRDSSRLAKSPPITNQVSSEVSVTFDQVY